MFSFLLIEDSRYAEEGRKEKDLSFGDTQNHSRAFNIIYSNNIVMLPQGLCLLFSFLSKENNKKVNSAYSASQR